MSENTNGKFNTFKDLVEESERFFLPPEAFDNLTPKGKRRNMKTMAFLSVLKGVRILLEHDQVDAAKEFIEEIEDLYLYS